MGREPVVRGGQLGAARPLASIQQSRGGRSGGGALRAAIEFQHGPGTVHPAAVIARVWDALTPLARPSERGTGPGKRAIHETHGMQECSSRKCPCVSNCTRQALAMQSPPGTSIQAGIPRNPGDPPRMARAARERGNRTRERGTIRAGADAEPDSPLLTLRVTPETGVIQTLAGVPLDRVRRMNAFCGTRDARDSCQTHPG